MILNLSSIDVADKSEELDERLVNIKDHFLKSLFVNTSGSLFEEDKIIYSFLLACTLVRVHSFKISLRAISPISFFAGNML
jgi:hypothetical protein